MPKMNHVFITSYSTSGDAGDRPTDDGSTADEFVFNDTATDGAPDDFTAEQEEQEVALLLPAVQAAPEAPRPTDADTPPQEEITIVFHEIEWVF